MKKIFYTIAMSVFLLSDIVFAEDDPHHIFDLVNNGFYAGFSALHLNYKEDAREVDPAIPDDVKEFGMAYGMAINVRNVFFEKLYTDLIGGIATGKIKYDGFGLYVPHEPIKLKRDNNFANVDVKLGVILLDREYFQLIPYGGFGFRYWNSNNDAPYEYSNFKAYAGSKINYVLFGDLVLSPYCNIGTTLGGHAKTKAYDKNKNFLGNANYVLGNKPIYELGLEINYRLEHEIFVTGIINYAAFKYGKSDPQYGFVEPNSKTNEIIIGIGVRYGFM